KLIKSMQFNALCKTRQTSRFCLPKILLIMRLTTFFLIVLSFQVHADGFSQKITISKKGASLEAVFHDIHRQSGYNFLYSDRVLANTTPINIHVKNVSLEEVLKECLKNQPLVFSIIDKTVIIKCVETSPVVQVDPPPIEISGVVTDSTGKPLVGVNILVKNMHTGTTTDKKGVFNLAVPDNSAILVISYLGFTTTERV